MSRLILILVLFINACSLLDPFVDRRREAGAKDLETLYIGQSKPEAPAICYNKFITSEEEMQKMADEECVKQGTGTHAVFDKQTIFTCRLLLPAHSYYKCVK